MELTDQDIKDIEVANELRYTIPETIIEEILDLATTGERQEVLFNTDNSVMATDAAQLSKECCQEIMKILTEFKGD